VPRISDDGKFTISLSIKEWVGVIVGIVSIASFIIHLEIDNNANTAFRVAQDKYNIDNNRAHDVISGNVNKLKWQVKRLNRKAGYHYNYSEDDDQ